MLCKLLFCAVPQIAQQLEPLDAEMREEVEEIVARLAAGDDVNLQPVAQAPPAQTFVR